MSMGRFKRTFETRQNVLECRHAHEHSWDFSLHPRVCCFRPHVLLLARRVNLLDAEDEGHISSAASVAFLEEVVSDFPV